MGEFVLTPREQELLEALEAQTQRIAELQNMIGYVALHINERWVVTQLTTQQKELWADAVESWRHRLHADEPEEITPYDRWWRDLDEKYDLDTSITHVTMHAKMDYGVHAWACRAWGYPPTATARALTLCNTLGEAKDFLDKNQTRDA